MPQRFLRPAITNSERWNACSFKAQSLYVRLMTLVDDYGRYDGRAGLLCGHAFSVWNEMNPKLAVNPQETAALCWQLSDNKMIEIYEVEGKRYIQLTQWQERARGESKWPSPDLGQILRNPADSCGTLRIPASLAIAISHESSPSPATIGAEAPPDPFMEVLTEWNKGNCLSECKVITDKRKVALKSRLQDAYFQKHWLQAIVKVRASAFCLGKNERGWKADIDWFLRPDSVPKIMEGKYDDHKPKQQSLAESWGTGEQP